MAAYCNVDDTPECTVAIALEDGADLVFAREVAADGLDLGALDILLGRILGQGLAGELRDADESLWERVAVVVERDDAVPPCLEQRVDHVRAWKARYRLWRALSTRKYAPM